MSAPLHHHDQSRRKFIQQAAIAAAAWPIVSTNFHPSGLAKAEKPLEVHIFSKCLHFLDHRHMAEFAARVGFDGVDLTVRSGGHVETEKAATDLPKAIDEIKRAGLKATMIAPAMGNTAAEVGQKVLDRHKAEEGKCVEVRVVNGGGW